jgi:predicted FMN-binding regulatory protein PaiB
VRSTIRCDGCARWPRLTPADVHAKPYIEADLATLHAGMRAWSFATLVTVGPNGVNATHLPFLLDATESEDGPTAC